MIRIIRVKVILLVAGPAIRGCAVVLAVDVALRTAHRHVHSQQRKVRVVVVEG